MRLPTLSALRFGTLGRLLPPEAGRQARSDFFSAAEEYTGLVSVTVDEGDLTFLVATWDRSLGRRLFTARYRSEMKVLKRTMALLERIGLREAATGTTFLDVGANIGTTSLPALRLHGFAEAVAVEPEPRNHLLLRANALLNDLDDRLRTLPIALSRRPGTARLKLHASNSGGHRLIPALGRGPASDDNARAIEVEQTSIEDLVGRNEIAPDKIGLVWIDAQGHEAQILAGAGPLLARGVPLVFELVPEWLGEEGLELIKELTASTYTQAFDLRGDVKAAVGSRGLDPIIERYREDGRKKHTVVLLVP